ncbi:MAG: hypothetical protein JW995_15440 [Melioribacteraceae bacterium]|nr:hypothetical protein [Melioribacteraceae bacterium]
MSQKKLMLILLFGSILLSSIITFGQEFPLREKYPSTKYITTKDLVDEYGKGIMIVDVRSKVEYDVVHIKEAVHVPWGQLYYGKDLEKAVNGNKATKIAVYCNGVTCAKSYKAADEAQKIGFTNIYVYDAGVMEWTKLYPDKSVLLGKSPVKKSDIISVSEFNSRLLDKDEFVKQIKSDNAVVIDIRDPAQRKQNPNFGKNVILSPMDKLVKALYEDLFKKNMGSKTIYFFDAVGRQVEWLQYYLADAGYENYFFLKGGVTAIF